jgi:hypothetical protein
MVGPTGAETHVALRLAGQNAVALFRDRVALSPTGTLPSRLISDNPMSSTAKAASGSSLI